jgi:hypothetical protein
MSKRYQGGVLGVGFNPLQAPNAPTGVTAAGGDQSASVSFTAPTNVGGSAITGYTVQSNPGAFAATGSSSPITVSGLSNGTAYTFNVWALNSYGPSPAGGPSGAVTPNLARGLFGSGRQNPSLATYTSSITYVNIATTGNSVSFGNLTVGRVFAGACSSSTRAVYAGGQLSGTGSDVSNVMDYVTIATTGNAVSFGQLAVVAVNTAGCANSTRGIFFGGKGTNGTDQSNVIQYITIASTGNGTDFGDCLANTYQSTAFSSSTRGVSAGGYYAGNANNVIQYITIASIGNATDFGDLIVAGLVDTASGCSSTRGVVGGGFLVDFNTSTFTPINVIQYVTIATTGNAIDFGDLTSARRNLGGTSSTIRALFAGGTDTPSNVIDYITIASAGNAVDFGDLLVATYSPVGASSAHGGLS